MPFNGSVRAPLLASKQIHSVTPGAAEARPCSVVLTRHSRSTIFPLEFPDSKLSRRDQPTGKLNMRSSIHALKSRRRTQPRIDLLEDRQLLSTITVNTTADETAADSTMSLREAIEVSDGTLSVSSLSTQEKAQVSGAVGSTNTIDFNIPTTDPGYNATTGVWTIAVNSDLPVISTNAAIIDGYSQPGAAKNTLGPGRQRQARDCSLRRGASA